MHGSIQQWTELAQHQVWKSAASDMVPIRIGLVLIPLAAVRWRFKPPAVLLSPQAHCNCPVLQHPQLRIASTDDADVLTDAWDKKGVCCDNPGPGTPRIAPEPLPIASPLQQEGAATQPDCGPLDCLAFAIARMIGLGKFSRPMITGDGRLQGCKGCKGRFPICAAFVTLRYYE